MHTDTLNLVRDFINRRPCLEARDYIRDWRDADGRAAYYSDKNAIALQLNDARRLLRYCELFKVDITAEFASNKARLHISSDGNELEYTAGQYWPTEYRAAACRKLASAIWAYWRDCGYTADAIRNKARAEFGRGIASRWF